MKKYSIILIVILFCISCKKDVLDIHINGVVLDSNSKKSISGIEIKVTCWKYGNSPDESYSDIETKTVVTNNKGEYDIQFDKGAFIEIEINSNNRFKHFHKTYDVYKKKNNVNISLIRLNE